MTTTFSIQHGAIPLCTWDTESNEAVFHERVPRRDDLLVIEESAGLDFCLSPSHPELEYRLSIGDMPVSDFLPQAHGAAGVSVAGMRFWSTHTYFESARAHTRILLESQPIESQVGNWGKVFEGVVYVLPSKLGEASYQFMVDDLQSVSRNLLVDLYGKSTRSFDLRFALEGKKFRTREEELDAIAFVLSRMEGLLVAVNQRPASRVRTELVHQTYWGNERLTPTAVTNMVRRGISPNDGRWPHRAVDFRRFESFDVAEHRVINAFLLLVGRRAEFCARVAHHHIQEIRAEQHLRDIQVGAGPSLFETIDMHKIHRLGAAEARSRGLAALAVSIGKLPFLRGVPAEMAQIRGGMFQRNGEYRAILTVIRGFLLANPTWYEGDEVTTVTKLTSRLFEQWCFMRIVESFRTSGLELLGWNEVLWQSLWTRFIFDFDRGLMFEGVLGANLRLRIRYEPWILGDASAARVKETLCRGSTTDVAWCPDVVIECLRKQEDVWVPVYGIVLDCKYTRRIREHHWQDTSKYLEIRSTATRKQVVKQLWLITPGDVGSIQSEDPAVHFGESGPSCATDEAVRFSMVVKPQGGVDVETLPQAKMPPFAEFAQGVISYFRREFSDYRS